MTNKKTNYFIFVFFYTKRNDRFIFKKSGNYLSLFVASPNTLYYTGGVETSTGITRIEVWQSTNNTWTFKAQNSPHLDRNNFAFVSSYQNWQ